jgi:hypothetical protein
LRNQRIIAMHVEAFIHKILSPVIHKARIKLLICVINAVIKTKELKLTTLGRALELPIQERSGIRKIDRLLSNPFFQYENNYIYQSIIKLVVGTKKHPIIIVDWTKLPNINEYALRAALAAQGRAITLYEEVHPKKHENNRNVQHQFLKKFKEMLPVDCKPIIVTDAGFRNPWFIEVLKLGWDVVGRVRERRTTYSDGKGFKLCKGLHKQASETPRCLGEMILTKSRPLKISFYLVKQKLKGRKKYTKNGEIACDKDSKSYSRGHREAWLLVSSLKSAFIAKKVVKIYRLRMTIEEGFRDMKSSQYGFGMEHNKTIKRERLSVWLMLYTLASLIAWIVGNIAEKLNLHYQFQANSIRDRRVLSFFYLGCQIIRKKTNISINFNNIAFYDVETYV